MGPPSDGKTYWGNRVTWVQKVDFGPGTMFWGKLHEDLGKTDPKTGTPKSGHFWGVRFWTPLDGKSQPGSGVTWLQNGSFWSRGPKGAPFWTPLDGKSQPGSGVTWFKKWAIWRIVACSKSLQTFSNFIDQNFDGQRNFGGRVLLNKGCLRHPLPCG